MRTFCAQPAAPGALRVHVQRFIQGKPATSAFACRDGEVLAALHMDVVAWQRATGPASLIRRTDCAAMDGAAHKIARRFKLSGLHGLDFMRDEDGDAPPHRDQSARDPNLPFGAWRKRPCGGVGRRGGAPCRDRQTVNRALPAGLAWRSGRPKRPRSLSRCPMGRSGNAGGLEGWAKRTNGMACGGSSRQVIPILTWRSARCRQGRLGRCPRKFTNTFRVNHSSAHRGVNRNIGAEGRPIADPKHRTTTQFMAIDTTASSFASNRAEARLTTHVSA